MSIYSDLLKLAVEGTPTETEGRRVDDLVERVRRHRVAATVRTAPGDQRFSAGPAVVEQLDYDVALIQLCRLLGVACRPDDFDRPEPARQHLEEALEARGLPLRDGADPPNGSDPLDGFQRSDGPDPLERPDDSGTPGG